MKRQIRRGVFETNSSSVHSLTMCSSEEYKAFEKGEMYIERWGDTLFTKEELVEHLKTVTDWKTKEPLYPGVDWSNDEEFTRAMKEQEYVTCEEYWDIVSEEYETFEEKYTDKNGNTTIAFGYYGHD